ncbi:hypothetical protein M3P05_09040 [Sansalvadorimonas sp. 2012CJ34-2]|uniref:Uncharacterized protein n=1 Tax=Parendozoicomonas callyspongiae TaxID=2942213 RepID=A0ABT0PFR5_9GAMM|nr:hypothetical protein [Sansalvadorimonas sp. 2012CJ34-2]MCL6270076.1 hypothetical protein [Sansalvadorimonas sp. 2012CJ34-2]
MTNSYDYLIEHAKPHASISSGENYEPDGWVRFAILMDNEETTGVAIQEYGAPTEYQDKYNFKLDKQHSFTPAPYNTYSISELASASPGPPSLAASPAVLSRSVSQESELRAMKMKGHVWVRIKNKKSEWKESDLPALSSDKRKKKSLVCNTYFVQSKSVDTDSLESANAETVRVESAEICCGVEEIKDPNYAELSLGVPPPGDQDEITAMNREVSEFIEAIEKEAVFPSGPFKNGETFDFSFGGPAKITIVGSGTSTVVFKIDVGKECKGLPDKYPHVNESALDSVRTFLPNLALRRIVLPDETQARSFYFHQRAHEVYLKENGVNSLETQFLKVGNVVYIVQPLLVKENLLDWYFKKVLLGKKPDEKITVLGQELTARKFLNRITEIILNDVRELSKKNKKHEDQSMPPGRKQMLAGYVDAKYANYAIEVESGHFVLRYMDPYPVHLKVFGRHPTEDNGRTPYTVFDTFFHDNKSDDALVSEGMVKRYLRKFEGYSDAKAIVLKLASDIIDTIYDKDECESRYHFVWEDLKEEKSDKYKLLKMVFDEIKNVCNTTFPGEVDLDTLEDDAINYWKKRIKSNMLLRLGLHYSKQVNWDHFIITKSSEIEEAKQKALIEEIRELRDGFMLSQTNDEEELVRWADGLLFKDGNRLHQLASGADEKKFNPDHVLPLLRGVVKTFTENRNYRDFSAGVVELPEKKDTPAVTEKATATGATNTPDVVITKVEKPDLNGKKVPVASVAPVSSSRHPSFVIPSHRPAGVKRKSDGANSLTSKKPVTPISPFSVGGVDLKKHPKSVQENSVQNESTEQYRSYYGYLEALACPPTLSADTGQLWNMKCKPNRHLLPVWNVGQFKPPLLRMQARSYDNYMEKNGEVRNCGIIITHGFWPLEPSAAEDNTNLSNGESYKADFEPFTSDGLVKTGPCKGRAFGSESLFGIFKENQRLQGYCIDAHLSWMIGVMPHKQKKDYQKILNDFKKHEYFFNSLIQKIPPKKGGYTIASPTNLMVFLEILRGLGDKRLKFNSSEAEYFLQMLSASLNMDIFISEVNGVPANKTDEVKKEEVVTRLRTYEYENGGLWAVRYAEKKKEDVEKEITNGNNKWIWLERTIRDQTDHWAFIKDYRSQPKIEKKDSSVSPSGNCSQPVVSPEMKRSQTYTPERVTVSAVSLMGIRSPLFFDTRGKRPDQLVIGTVEDEDGNDYVGGSPRKQQCMTSWSPPKTPNTPPTPLQMHSPPITTGPSKM